MKPTPPTIPGALMEFRALDDKRKEVGRVYKRQTTKSVFRANRHMTVPVLGWFFRRSGGKEVGTGPNGPLWVEMSGAVDALLKEVRS